MDIQGMMKQAKVMQERMQELQAELGDVEVRGQAGGGLVNIVMTCKGELRKIDISPEVIDPAEKETLEDLLIAALNAARINADNKMASETAKMMAEFGLPADGGLPGA